MGDNNKYPIIWKKSQDVLDRVSNYANPYKDDSPDAGPDGQTPAAAPQAGAATTPAQNAPGQQSKPPQIKGDADYNALPSGTVYIAPDGKVRTKS